MSTLSEKIAAARQDTAKATLFRSFEPLYGPLVLVHRNTLHLLLDLAGAAEAYIEKWDGELGHPAANKGLRDALDRLDAVLPEPQP